MSDTEPAAYSDGISSDDDPTRLPKRRGRKRKRHSVATSAVAVLAVLTVALGLGGVFFYRHLNDNLDYQNLDAQLTNRPAKVIDTGPHEPINLLIMGSDSRDGAGDNIDGLKAIGERSDTTILIHLSADRKSAYGVSIPRDSLVDRPDCLDEHGDTIPGAVNTMWNEAFSVGGPACTIQQFEQLTGVRIDNYVVLDFSGFRSMVDAIDGVEVCIPKPISDPAHGIDIPAGTREIQGREALNYVRARYTLGDGSDIGRIKRQQAFVAAMASKVVSAGTLSHFNRLIGFLNAATKSLQTDFSSITDIAKVGLSFKSIGLDNIKFITVPWQYSPVDPNRVAWLPEAEQLWRLTARDEPLPRRLLSGVITAENAVKDGRKKRKDGAEREAAGLCA